MFWINPKPLKKNDTCAKPQIESTIKSWNNLVLEFSTAAYEYARQCLITILDSSTQYVGMIRHSEETLGAKVDTCIKPIIRQKAYQHVQHMHHSANYQPIQRENRINMPPQPRPAVFNKCSDRQPDNRNKHHNRMNHFTSQTPRFNSEDMHQNYAQVFNNQSSQKCPIVYPSIAQEAQVKTNYINRPSDIPLFASPGDIPCNKYSANITQQEILQQTLSTSNYSPQDDTSASETKQNCPTTLESSTSHQAKPDKSSPPDPNMIRIAQS
ncbi:RGP1 [Mytilus edulis]|uniref:RGP1 n=1 Tax=Mytilus edulis TaxID=6550 RepID=A0A8S3RA29_MYTED|nr:RGP1 [Mytilus edulis]